MYPQHSDYPRQPHWSFWPILAIVLFTVAMIMLNACNQPQPQESQAKPVQTERKSQATPDWQTVDAGCISYMTLNGAESGQFTDSQIKATIALVGYRSRILDYASPVDNILGLAQRNYLIWARTNARGKDFQGTMVYFHGGGGDRGFADNFGSPDDPSSTAAMTIFWLEKGFDVVLPEYPRGWMSPQWCDDCPWNTSTAAYDRQEAAARLSFEYSRRALEYIANKGTGPMYVMGTSFGGAITMYVTAMSEAGYAESLGIKAALVGYGGILASDEILDTQTPILFLGGLDDNIVPADQNNFYWSSRSIQGLGIRGTARAYSQKGGLAAAVFSSGAPAARGYQPIGHSYGLFETNADAYELFYKWLQSPYVFQEDRLLSVDSRGRPVGFTLQPSGAVPSPDIPNCD